VESYDLTRFKAITNEERSVLAFLGKVEDKTIPS
jgi:hypothetical protein